MSLISESDIELIKSRNIRLIFTIGLPGCGKESQVEKVSNEFKYSKIILGEEVHKEISSGSELGNQIKESHDKKEPLKSEVIVALLVQSILKTTGNTIFVDGFPFKLEDALYFEQNIIPIELILVFNGSEETCLKNLREDPNNQLKEEDLKDIFAKTSNGIKEISQFYSPYSIIREIDIENKGIDAINIEVKRNLYPIIYSIIGKRYSGKTEMSKVLHDRMGITLIDFNTFLNSEEIIKRKNDNEFVVNKFILKLRQMTDKKVLIEDFPQNKEQYTHFVNNCKPFEQIIYLQADNSSCLERLNRIPLTDPNYTNSAQLNKLLFEFEGKQKFYEYLKSKEGEKFQEINVDNHKILTIKKMIKQLQPFCAFVETNQGDGNAKEELFTKMKDKYGYTEILLPKVIEDAKKRKLIKIEEGEELTLEQKIDLIRPLLFCEKYNKIILNTFPSNIKEFNEFEEKLCYVTKYIIFTESHNLPSVNNEESMAVICYKNNLLATLNPRNLTDYRIEECLNMTKDINIVYGMPGTGKSTVAHHLKNKYNYELLDLVELSKEIKNTKKDPENPEAEPEITFEDLITGLENYLNKLPRNKRIIVDNFYMPGAPDPFLPDTDEKALKILKVFEKQGNFRNFYEIKTSEKILMDKFKAKEGTTEEMTDEQKTAFEESLEKPKKILEEISQNSANIIKVFYRENHEKALKYFDSQYSINFIIIKHDYDICLEKSLQLFCARNRVLYINVPKLIYEHFYENDSEAKLLESSYGKKVLKEKCSDPNNFDEMIYYKYNPIFFERELVVKLIKEKITKFAKNIEESGNFVILSGYLNYDLIENPNEPYNLPLLELKTTIELGELTSFIQLTRKEIAQDEDEKPEQVIVEKPKKKEKKEGEEENKEDEQQPEENAEEGAVKFKPENFAWTNYDGKPRNYVQILKRLKGFPVKIIEGSETCREELIKALGNHLDNFMNKEELKYKGMITYIKINGEVPQETTEAVNKVSKFVEGRREADGMSKGKTSKDKGGAGAIYEVL